MIGKLVKLYRSRLADRTQKRPWALLCLQTILIILLCLTIVVVVSVDQDERLYFYLSFIFILFILLGSALIFNLFDKYNTSAWITVICFVLGPWGAALLDPAVFNGDIVPLIYIVLSIQIGSVLLSEKATLLVAAFQLISMILFIVSSPFILRENWPSLITYIIFSASLGTVISFMSRKQFELIEKQKLQLQGNEAKLRDMATKDSLTGLFNRGYMEDILSSEISLALKENKDLGIIMCDIDDFKFINDTYGHEFGDSVIISIADVLKSNIRDSDIACRYGGDEFILVLPNCSLESARIRAEKLRSLVNQINLNNGRINCGTLSASFGVAALPGNGLTTREIMRAADNGLYAAKRAGRNQVCDAS